MKIVAMEPCHVLAAARLAQQGYARERQAVPCLPETDYTENFSKWIGDILRTGAGAAALRDGELAGFLCAMPVEGFKGVQRGVYSPLYAHGAADPVVYPRLYAAAAQTWVRNGCLTHSVTLFEHDAPAVETWFRLRFGSRCVDGMRALGPVGGADRWQGEVRRAVPGDAEALLPLYRGLERYLAEPPLFMAQFRQTELAEVRRELAEHPVWLALQSGVAVGYLVLHPEAETPMAADPGTLNVCGAYVREDCRGSGAAAALLGAAVSWLRARGYARLGVDYESFNPLGNRFWGRHVSPYTVGMMRRLDERILWADGARLQGNHF